MGHGGRSDWSWVAWRSGEVGAEVRLTVMVFVCSGLATRAALYLAQIPDILEVWGSGGKVKVVEGWREKRGAEEVPGWSASDW